MYENKLKALSAIDQISDEICDLSDAIWDVPETAFLEIESARLQCDLLKKIRIRCTGESCWYTDCFFRKLGKWKAGNRYSGGIRCTG